MSPRRYEQTRRAENAALTRAAILDALGDLLRSAGSGPISIEETARRAGVSRTTVYLIFESRAGLFDALGRDLFDRGGFGELQRRMASEDSRDGLRGGIRSAVQMYAVDRDVLRALFSMAALDPAAVGGAVERIEATRALGMDYLAGRLAAQRVLRADIDRARAADVLWLITGFDSFDLLYDGRSMSVDEVATRLIDVAEHAILDRPGEDRTRGRTAPTRR